MVSANHIDKEILTLGEKWQNFVAGKMRSYQSPAQSVLRQNIDQKVTKFLCKWQLEPIADMPSLQLPLAANIHQKYKYLHPANKFQRQQHQPNFSAKDVQEEDWWSDFDLLQQNLSQPSAVEATADTLDTLNLGAFPFTSSQPRLNNLSQIKIDRQIVPHQQKSAIVNNIIHKYNRVDYHPQSKLNYETKSINFTTESLESSPQQEQREVDRQIEQSSYSNINSQLRSFLGNLLNLRIPQVKIYSNQIADKYAKKLQADAITYEDKILVRADKYNLNKPENIALLGHELTHASSLIPQRQNHSTGSNNLVEEQTALSNEQKVLNYFSLPGTKINYERPSVLSGGISSINQSSNLTPTALPPPQKADSNRELNQSPTMTPNIEISDSQIKMLKAEILQEIARQIREHSERGG